MYTCVYIYIYIYREREREIDRYICTHTYRHVGPTPCLPPDPPADDRFLKIQGQWSIWVAHVLCF